MCAHPRSRETVSCFLPMFPWDTSALGLQICNTLCNPIQGTGGISSQPGYSPRGIAARCTWQLSRPLLGSPQRRTEICALGWFRQLWLARPVSETTAGAATSSAASSGPCAPCRLPRRALLPRCPGPPPPPSAWRGALLAETRSRRPARLDRAFWGWRAPSRTRRRPARGAHAAVDNRGEYRPCSWADYVACGGEQRVELPPCQAPSGGCR